MKYVIISLTDMQNIYRCAVKPSCGYSLTLSLSKYNQEKGNWFPEAYLIVKSLVSVKPTQFLLTFL